MIECLLCPHRALVQVGKYPQHLTDHHPETAGDWARNPDGTILTIRAAP